MAAQSTIFPIFLRAEYREDANGLPKFISRIQQARQISEAEFRKVGAALGSALSAPRTSAGGLDLGVKQLQSLIAEQKNAAAAARELEAATKAVAFANGGLRKDLVPSVTAYRDLAKAKEAELAASQAQLTAMRAIQAELDKGTTAVRNRIRAEQDLANFRKTANVNEGALRLAAGQASIDRAALSGATLESVLGRTRVSNPQVEQQRKAEQAAAERTAAALRAQAQATDELRQAEAAAASGAKLLQAIYRNTALQLNETGTEFKRTSASARESARVFEEAFAAQQRQADAAAAALREQAAALAALKAQINPAAAAQEQFSQKVAFAKAALDRGELSQREYAQAVRLASAALREAGQAEIAAAAARNGFTTATRAGTTARGNVINSVRAERTAFIQLGQQLHDVAVQAQLGTSAFVIFGQQAPQAFFALTGLADSANRTQAAIGRFAQFMSGPFGAAIFVGVAALGPLIAKLFESAEQGDKLTEALDKAKFAADGMSSAQSILGNVIDLTTGRMREQTDAANNLARAQLQLAEVRARIAADEARATLQAASQRTVQTNIASAGVGSFGGTVFRSVRSPSVSAAAAQQALRGDVEGALNALKEAVDTGRTTAAIYAETATAIANLGVETENIRRFGDALKALEGDQKALQGFLKTDKPKRSPKSRVDREPEQLARFAGQAAESIARINDRFSEQTRLVTQSLQANRELDSIIAQTNKKMAEAKGLTKAQREEFEGIIKAAEGARQTIDAALLRPFEDMKRESEERLQIEKLLAQGRVDEAAGLQAVLQLQRQIGTETELRAALQRAIAEANKTEEERIRNLLSNYGRLMEGVRGRIVAEQSVSREYQAQRELLELQADVARNMADSLRNVFSGRGSFGDLIRNFRQSLQDLQGARLFEDLFGPAFRQLEEELRGNTPQGRANARYTANVNETADITETLADALAYLTGAVTNAGNRLFGLAANDNGSGVTIRPDGSMVLTGNRANGKEGETEIARRSVVDIAKEIGNTVGARFASVFEGVLGPRALEALGQTIGGFIAGKALGGTTGGILGTLQGALGFFRDKDGNLSESLQGISDKLGGALKGSNTGTTVAGISKALGLGGSTTGAQIGGALGSFLPFPGGDIVGAIAGNILGGLLKSPKRGSATIGGVGGSLGITGTVGNSSTLRDTANNLAGSVLNTVNDIARQLGATVDASRGSVSIGQRKDNLRVDPRGRGATKIGNGAINFGDDAEAAVAFAVQNLIQDGVITGLRAAESRLLQAGKDINAAVRDVLTFRSVFDRLKEIKDPIGAALDAVNREFDQFRELFARAGADAADLAALEELYGLERARAIEDATDRVVGSLKSLLQDLRIGDNGLSLRTRRNNALGDFNALAARVAAGDASAFDDFAEISKQLLDIERQLFGSTQSYFDRLAQVTSLTEQAIAGQTNVSSIAAAAVLPNDETTAIAKSIDAGIAEQVNWLKAINDNIIAMNPANWTGGGISGGRADNFPLPMNIANF